MLAKYLPSLLARAIAQSITSPSAGGWTPQPGDYLLNETGLFLTDESGNQLTA